MKKLLISALLLIIPTAVFSYGEYNNYNNVETLIIFDLSSSMILPFEDRSRFDVAVETANNILDLYEDDDKIGLRIIGMAKPIALTPDVLLGITPESFCTLTSTPIPVEPGTKSRIKRKMQTLFPLGNTPIELALRSSINNDFKYQNSLKHIILITDGGENCGGDACSYISEITETRKDIKIDVVAIRLESEDFPLYNCLTRQTNGEIINIDSINDIKVNIKPPQRNYTAPQPYNNVQPAVFSMPQMNNKYILKSHLFEIFE